MALKWCVPRGLLHQYIAGVAACLGVLTSGTCYGWMTPILTYLQSPESPILLTVTETTWIVSVIELGNLVSPIPAGFLVNYIGRKPVVLASGPLYILSWLMILYFPSVLMLGIARVLQGFAMGLVFTVAPVYLGEIASVNTRGAITSLFFNFWWLGYLIEYVVGPLLDYKTFTYFTAALNVPFILFYFWQPESPYYYLIVGNRDKAYESLKWFRDSPPEKLNSELEEIMLDIQTKSKSAKLTDLLATSVDRKAMTMLLVLTAVRICSGTGSITVYATQIFEQTPKLSFSPDTVTMALGVVMFFGGICSSFTADTLGRRPLLLISCFGSLICQICTGTFYFLLSNTSVKVSQVSWIAPAFIMIYSAVCSAGMYPVCSCYTSELFNSNTRGLAASFGAVNVTVFSFFALVSYQPITDWLGIYANFYIYSLILLLGFVYFYINAMETKGKSFAEIRQELGVKNKTHHMSVCSD